ncbi:HlyD family efflux transporter periplasmic adaptor subunit [Falsiroseomonas sp.]|uniref:efflux RND transporter periplasmic adaptor subunit n=1 Tax=Falsiroseomonas sp. TaxID=2870721 RepID=UPI003F719435
MDGPLQAEGAPLAEDFGRLAATLTGCASGRILLQPPVEPALAAAWAEALAEPGLRLVPGCPGFCAGLALRDALGRPLGVLVLQDPAPRELAPAQREGLALLATRAAADLALRESHDRLQLGFGAALDGLADGVLALGSDGAVTTLNSTAAAMLGLDAASAPGATLAALLPQDGSADALLDALLAPVSAEVPPPRQVVDFAGRRLAVSSRAYRLRVGPQAGRLGLTATLTDVTESERLAAAEAALSRDLAEQHRKLQTAYLQLEQGAIRMQETQRRIRLARLGGAAGVALLLLATGAYAWLPLPTGWSGAPEANAGGMPPITLAPTPISSRIAVVGMLDAGSMVSVVGPFDGLVQERLFQYGSQVERGQPLLRLDLNDVEVRLRDARSAEIRARQRVAELRGWTTGFEVARARRAVAQARLEQSDITARVAQTRMLLSRGIIAADEHRALVQQQRNQQIQVQAAENDLEATLARGDEQTLRIAELELANAEVKVRELEADLANATVRAPVAGVVLMPPEAPGGRRAETIEPGSRVQRGQTMFTLGALETFQVRATVDEIDVNKVRIGQKVTVTGDAFGDLVLEGRVTSVAAQAGGEASSRGGMPTFPVAVAVEGLSPEQRRMLAVGMSASLSIIIYEKPDALVLPPFAIQGGPGGRMVRVRRGGREEVVPVTLGISTPGGVEIREGLAPGDLVLP